MTTNETDAAPPAADPTAASGDLVEMESELPATPPSKTPKPLGNWEPNSPPSN